MGDENQELDEFIETINTNNTDSLDNIKNIYNNEFEPSEDIFNNTLKDILYQRFNIKFENFESY